MNKTWKLKFLSGAMYGVEYALICGDSIFTFGPYVHLLDGVVADSVARSDNSFYVPDETLRSSLLVRIHQDGSVEIGLLDDLSGLGLQTIHLNEVIELGEIKLSIKQDGDDWASSVLSCSRSPRAVAPAPAQEKRTHRIRAVHLLAGTALCAAVSIGVLWPAKRSDDSIGMAVVDNSPSLVSVEYRDGRDGRRYGLVANASKLAPAQRESSRGSSEGFVVWRALDAERERLEQGLVLLDVPVVILRLDRPTHPTLVVASDGSDASSASARQVLLDAMPYAQDVAVLNIADEELVRMAKSAFVAMGVEPRVEGRVGGRSVTNGGDLSDAQLNELRRFSRDFSRDWGERRLAINVRMREEANRAGNFRYRPGLLTSLSDGSWGFIQMESSQPRAQ